MIEFSELNKYIKNEETDDILNKHLNTMLKRTVIYIAHLLDDENNTVFFIHNQNKEQFRKKLVPPTVVNDEDRKKLIKVILEKLYSEKTEQFTGDERYTLARAIDYGIKIEESAIDKLIEDEKMSKAKERLLNYRIDSDKRDSIRKEIEKKAKTEDMEDTKKVLKDESKFYKEFVLKNTDDILFFLEYPTALNLIFDKKEYELIVNLQPENM